MKKYLLVIVLFTASYYAQGQDLKNVKLYVNLQQYDKAKPEIDAFFANEKNTVKAEGWFYKALIYTALGVQETIPLAQRKTYLLTSFEALKKYRELDPKTPLSNEETNKTIFNTYYGFDDIGIKMYKENNLAETYTAFQKALEIHDYMVSNGITGVNGYKFSSLDTSMVWNLAVLANELKKKDDALIYFKKVADANLNDEKFATAYDELIKKYKAEKNAELFAKYLASAKKYYPIDSTYWEVKEIEFALDGIEGEALLNKYDELTKTLPNNYIVFYNYAVEIDKFLNNDASKTKDAATLNGYRAKLEELFKKAASLKSTIESNLQLANLYYSRSFDQQERADKIKGTKPAELKVKNELLTSVKATMNNAIIYAGEAARLLGELKEYKFADKENYKLALEILSKGYKTTGNMEKYNEIEKKRVEVGKL